MHNILEFFSVLSIADENYWETIAFFLQHTFSTIYGLHAPVPGLAEHHCNIPKTKAAEDWLNAELEKVNRLWNLYLQDITVLLS